jgi:hypothetical protein
MRPYGSCDSGCELRLSLLERSRIAIADRREKSVMSTLLMQCERLSAKTSKAKAGHWVDGLGLDGDASTRVGTNPYSTAATLKTTGGAAR